MNELKSNKFIIFLVRVIIVVCLYYLIIRKIEWILIFELLTPSIIPYLVLSTFLILIQAFFCSWRWQYICKNHVAVAPSLIFTFMVYLENLFYNQFFPATVGGDVLRIMRWQRAGIDGTIASSTVILDRLSGLNGAAFISLLMVPIAGRDPRQILTVITTLILSIFVILVTVGVFITMRWPIIISPFKRYAVIWSIFNKIRTNITFDSHYIITIGLSVIGYIIGGMSTACLAYGFNIQIDIVFIVVLSSFITLVSTIPITIGGWGLREATFVTILSPLGIDAHQAFLLGFFVGLASLLSALPGGIITIAGFTEVRGKQI